MSSIRLRLMIFLVVIVGLLWGITFVWTYHGVRREIHTLFDGKLEEIAQFLKVGVQHEFQEQDFHRLLGDLLLLPYTPCLAFQVWTRDEQLLFRSPYSPLFPFSTHLGFRTDQVGAERWRIYETQSAGGKLYIQVGQCLKERGKVARYIVLEHMMPPLLWVFPFIALGLWWGIGRGLAPLRRMAESIRRCKDMSIPEFQGAVPLEIQPLVQALEGLMGDLKRRMDRERQFIAEVSHELRTPLAGLKLQAQLALRASDRRHRIHLEKVIEGIDRLEHLVEQLLFKARLDNEHGFLPRQETDLAALARQAARDLAFMAEARGIELEVEGTFPLLVEGNEGTLYILVRNLVENSLRHVPPKGKVVVAVKKVPGGIRLQVEDTGPGIPAEEREAVFQPFYRRGEGTGSGLGLAIVARIAALHGASIRLDDASWGKGLRVEVDFPAGI